MEMGFRVSDPHHLINHRKKRFNILAIAALILGTFAFSSGAMAGYGSNWKKLDQCTTGFADKKHKFLQHETTRTWGVCSEGNRHTESYVYWESRFAKVS